MNGWIAAGTVAAAFGTFCAPAAAQQAPDDVKKMCRETAAQISRVYMDAKKRGVKDLEKGVYRASSNWAEQVAHYMAQAASRSDSLTEGELTLLGASYCVERRPTMSQ
jgi:hypothetical protein